MVDISLPQFEPPHQMDMFIPPQKMWKFPTKATGFQGRGGRGQMGRLGEETHPAAP